MNGHQPVHAPGREGQLDLQYPKPEVCLEPQQRPHDSGVRLRRSRGKLARLSMQAMKFVGEFF